MNDNSKINDIKGKELNFIQERAYKEALEDIKRYVYPNRYKFDYIYGIPRGGLIPAVYLSHKLDIPMIMDLHEIESNKSLLITEDIIDSGNTIKQFINNLPSTIKRYEIVSIISKASSKNLANYSSIVIKNDDWIVFPYEVKY